MEAIHLIKWLIPWRILPCSWVRCSAAVNTNHKHICQTHQFVLYMMLLTSQKCFRWTSLETRWPCIGIWSCINYKLFHMGTVYNWVNYYLALAGTLSVVLNYIYFDVLQSLLDRCFLWHNHKYRAGQKICL